jgi:CheY-like chemotaxis protein
MSKKRVLMVDDEAGLTRMVKVALEARGQYSVQVVNDPRDAIATARSFKPDIILLDLVMPGMDGGEVANLLRAESELRDVPVIFLTATARGKEASHEGLVSGGYLFLSKPVALADLINCMETCFAQKESNPPKAPPATGATGEA